MLVIATTEHRSQLLRDLQDCGLDVREHAREGRYTMLDARQTLAAFMQDGSRMRICLIQRWAIFWMGFMAQEDHHEAVENV
jgi:hypothetical protein